MYRLTENDHANTPVPEAGNPQHAWPDAFVVDQSRFEVRLNRAADGTPGNRFRNSPAQRQAFLKTGTLTGVRSLAGCVRGKSGQMIAVTIIVNSPRASAALPAMDRLIEWVVDNG